MFNYKKQTGHYTHPISHLIHNADQRFENMMEKESHTMAEAVKAYQTRRGRHPPPWFDKWYDFAVSKNAVIVEDFWDRIYGDLGPFWGVHAKQLREQANSYLHRISVRDGNATWRSDGQDRPWMPLWTNMTNTVAQHLPDVHGGDPEQRDVSERGVSLDWFATLAMTPAAF